LCARSAHGGSAFLSFSFVRWTSISVSKSRHNDRSLACQPQYATFDELISEALTTNLPRLGPRSNEDARHDRDGLRLFEIVNLRESTIMLTAHIPHVRVFADGRRLKTGDSERQIPLVGVARKAFALRPLSGPTEKGVWTAAAAAPRGQFTSPETG
jgi:hypothetical protein